jgi:hypothetical protein
LLEEYNRKVNNEIIAAKHKKEHFFKIVSAEAQGKTNNHLNN